mgnify:CR=1 FL=1
MRRREKDDRRSEIAVEENVPDQLGFMRIIPNAKLSKQGLKDSILLLRELGSLFDGRRKQFFLLRRELKEFHDRKWFERSNCSVSLGPTLEPEARCVDRSEVIYSNRDFSP